ncbi:MAG: hypothetical protein ABIE07_11660 [Candidatus Zixiibacteriota bacterium]
MRKLLILTLIALLAGSFAMASNTRVHTMGEVNNIVKDDANIWLYPQTINNYPGLFSAEFDENDFWMGGANFGFNEENPWVLGAYFNTDNYYHEIFNDYGHWEGGADHRIDLFYGRNLGEMPFGFVFSYNKRSEKNEDTSTVNHMEGSLTRFGFGFGLTAMEGKLDVAAGITMTSWTDKDYNGTTSALEDETKPSGNTEFGFTGRYWMDPKGKATLVPHAALWISKQGLEDYDDGDLYATYTYKHTMWELGMGMNYEAKEDVLVVTDFGITSWSGKDEADPASGDSYVMWKDKEMTVPYFKIGIDAKVIKWLDFRAGVTNYWISETWEPSEVMKRKYGWGETDTYLGAGFHWGDFELDAEINTDFIENGPYFISGEYDYLTERVTINYWFD